MFRFATERMLSDGSHHQTSATSGASKSCDEAEAAPEIQHSLVLLHAHRGA